MSDIHPQAIVEPGAKIGKNVTIMGWVSVRRDQGKMVFFDMRDMTGKVQCVALPSRAEAMRSSRS